MFQLYDRTRRRIALTAFVLLCLVPTALVVAWGLARRTSWHAAAEAERLTSLCGLKVSLSGIRHPFPGEVVYEGLTLADPETGNKVLYCARLQARWTTSTDANSRSRPTLVLTAVEPEVFFDPLVGQIGRLTERLLSRRPETEAVVRLAAGEALLQTADGSQPLVDVQGTGEFQSGGSLAELRFLWGRDTQGDPVRVRVIRNRQASPGTTSYELTTGSTPLPCSVLAVAIPGLEQLGTRSQFRGYCGTTETPDGWAGEIKDGQLTEVDLESLLGNRFPHRLSGQAQINLFSASFRQGRIELADGEITAGPGVISRSLIDAAVDRLGLPGASVVNASPSGVRYERLASRFYLDSRGLWLQGACNARTGRAILMDQGNPILGEPPPEPRSIGAVVQTLVSLSGVPVPATQQAAWLIRRLPLPDTPANQAVPVDTARSTTLPR